MRRPWRGGAASLLLSFSAGIGGHRACTSRACALASMALKPRSYSISRLLLRRRGNRSCRLLSHNILSRAHR